MQMQAPEALSLSLDLWKTQAQTARVKNVHES